MRLLSTHRAYSVLRCGSSAATAERRPSSVKRACAACAGHHVYLRSCPRHGARAPATWRCSRQRALRAPWLERFWCGAHGLRMAEPEERVVVHHVRPAQPSALGGLQAEGAVDRAERSRPVDSWQKLAQSEAVLGVVLQVQPEEPPAVVVGRRDVGIRALEERDGLGRPRCRLSQHASVRLDAQLRRRWLGRQRPVWSRLLIGLRHDPRRHAHQASSRSRRAQHGRCVWRPAKQEECDSATKAKGRPPPAAGARTRPVQVARLQHVG